MARQRRGVRDYLPHTAERRGAPLISVGLAARPSGGSRPRWARRRRAPPPVEPDSAHPAMTCAPEGAGRAHHHSGSPLLGRPVERGHPPCTGLWDRVSLRGVRAMECGPWGVRRARRLPSRRRRRPGGRPGRRPVPSSRARRPLRRRARRPPGCAGRLSSAGRDRPLPQVPIRRPRRPHRSGAHRPHPEQRAAGRTRRARLPLCGHPGDGKDIDGANPGSGRQLPGAGRRRALQPLQRLQRDPGRIGRGRPRDRRRQQPRHR